MNLTRLQDAVADAGILAAVGASTAMLGEGVLRASGYAGQDLFAIGCAGAMGAGLVYGPALAILTPALPGSRAHLSLAPRVALMLAHGAAMSGAGIGLQRALQLPSAQAALQAIVAGAIGLPASSLLLGLYENCLQRQSTHGLAELPPSICLEQTIVSDFD